MKGDRKHRNSPIESIISEINGFWKGIGTTEIRYFALFVSVKSMAYGFVYMIGVSIIIPCKHLFTLAISGYKFFIGTTLENLGLVATFHECTKSHISYLLSIIGDKFRLYFLSPSLPRLASSNRSKAIRISFMVQLLVLAAFLISSLMVRLISDFKRSV